MTQNNPDNVLTNVLETDKEIEALANELQSLKNLEANTRFRRVEAELRLIDLIGVKVEGATSYKTPMFKVTTTGSLTRKLDDDPDTTLIANGVPPAIVNRVIKHVPQLDVRELKYIQKNEPQYYSELIKVITTKDRKPSVKVELN